MYVTHDLSTKNNKHLHNNNILKYTYNIVLLKQRQWLRMPRKHGTYIILWYYSTHLEKLSVTYSTQRFSPWAITTTKKSGPITQVTRAQGHASSRPRSCTGSTCAVCPCVYDYNIIVVTMRIIENAFCAHLLCNDGTALAACWQINWVDICVTFPNTRHT